MKAKFQRQQDHAAQHLANFDRHRFMFWSPSVPVGYLTRTLSEVEGLELVINGEYKRRVTEMIDKARREKQDTGNPVFRVFQILGALRD